MKLKVIISICFFISAFNSLGQETLSSGRFFHIDAGRHTIHEDEPWGFILNAEYGKELAPGFALTGTLGFAAQPNGTKNGNTGTGFSNLLFGFDLSLLPKSRFSPHFSINLGLMNEGGGLIWTYNAQTGVQFRTSKNKRNYIRLSIQAGRHGADDDELSKGPFTNTIGFVHIF